MVGTSTIVERTREACYFSRQGSLLSQNPPPLGVGSMSTRQQSNLNAPKNEPKKFSTSDTTNSNGDNTVGDNNSGQMSFPQSGNIYCGSGNSGDMCGENRITTRCPETGQVCVPKRDTNKNIIYKNTNNILYNSSVENFENSIDVENSPNKLENWRRCSSRRRQ